jgi:hypothetical protein
MAGSRLPNVSTRTRPVPDYEGKGPYEPVIDERASDEQVDELFKILGGEEQESTTVFNIYGLAINFECDIKAAPWPPVSASFFLTKHRPAAIRW